MDPIRVWRVDLRSDAWRSLEDVLSTEECRRAARFRFERHRRRFVVRRATLRSLLAQRLRTAPSGIRYRLGAQGKPFVAGPPGAPSVQFSLSHSGDLALVAIAIGMEIGVDLELVRAHSDAGNVAERHFTPQEVALVESETPSRRARTFLCLWTRKEAVLKAEGTGLGGSLADFSVLPPAPGWLGIRSASGFEGAVRDIDLDSNHVAALAVLGSSRPAIELRDAEQPGAR